MSATNPTLVFEVLLNDAFSTFNNDATIVPDGNKHVLSAINDFEDEKWRYSKFQSFIWDNIVETALSNEEREKLAGSDHSRLIEAAKSLRLTDADKSDIGKGSELAEIVLYGIMKHHYGALPVVPKIFYKQNSQDNAKGADSVHIVVLNADFSLWFGEAKFYNEIEDARLDSIVTSVGNALDTEKLKKENSIISNVRDLDGLVLDPALRASIKAALRPQNSIDLLKPRLHIPILLLHECERTKACKDLTDAYRNDLIAYHKERAIAYFKKQAAKLKDQVSKYSDITFHVILFPVPDKVTIVDAFVANVVHYKGQ